MVRDRSLLDSQDSEFSEIYTSYWQEKELEEAGIAASKVQEILNQSSISTMQILGKDGASNYWYTYILVFVLYFLVIFYGQMIATSITSEKSNRAIEVLVTTVVSQQPDLRKSDREPSVYFQAVILGSSLIAYHFCPGPAGITVWIFCFHIPAEVWAAFIVFSLLSYPFVCFSFSACWELWWLKDRRYQ